MAETKLMVLVEDNQCLKNKSPKWVFFSANKSLRPGVYSSVTGLSKVCVCHMSRREIKCESNAVGLVLRSITFVHCLDISNLISAVQGHP